MLASTNPADFYMYSILLVDIIWTFFCVIFCRLTNRVIL